MDNPTEQYACQLKRGRAMLQPNYFGLNQSNRGIYEEHDSLQFSSCDKQALNYQNVSQLVLAEYESESRPAEGNSSELVSRDACKLFMFSGSSAEARVYRQLVVQRIKEGDITTTLKLCCIGHQTQFSRYNYNCNLPISDAQAFRDKFEELMKAGTYEPEISELLSICDEWYRVLEQLGMRNIAQRELLREWIGNRQYANTADAVVSDVITQCTMINKKELDKTWRKWREMRIDEEETKMRMEDKQVDEPIRFDWYDM